MNVVDLILAAVFTFAVYDGVRRGSITAGFSLIVWSLARTSSTRASGASASARS